MCDFISWVEHKGDIHFLTGEIINSSEFQERAKEDGVSADDYLGHGTIRWWYDLPYKTLSSRQCTLGLSHVSSRRYPSHSGVFFDGNDRECTDFSSPDNFPPEIVEAIKAGRFRGIGQKPIRLLNALAQAKYERVCDNARDGIWLPPERRHLAEFFRVCDQAFWNLFANPANRAEAWR